MIGRLFAIGLLAFIGVVAASASSSGSGAESAWHYRTAEKARAEHAAKVERQRLLALEADRRRRYASGEMVGEERRQYEAELAEKARLEEKRRQQAAAAAAAAAARRNVRGTRSSGGGFSSGK